ncbi:MAG: hypothetical protein WC262_12985 [Bacteroidales bacterium]|jgi:hypothetical protein
MDEDEKMRVVRELIAPTTRSVLEGVIPLFTPEVIADVKEVRRRYATLPVDELLRPFDS